VIYDVAPAARVTTVMARKTLNALTAQPRPADCRRICHRVLDVVHAGKMMLQHTCSIQSVEQAVASDLTEAGVDLAKLLMNLEHSRGSGSRRFGAPRFLGGRGFVVEIVLRCRVGVMPQIGVQASPFGAIHKQAELHGPIEHGCDGPGSPVLQTIQRQPPLIANLIRPRGHERRVPVRVGYCQVMALDLHRAQFPFPGGLRHGAASRVNGEAAHGAQRIAQANGVAGTQARLDHRHDQRGCAHIQPERVSEHRLSPQMMCSRWYPSAASVSSFV